MPLPPLYAHQARTIEQVRAAYREGARRICVVLPTGAGKTRTALEIVSGGVAKGRSVLWLAHREELIDQPSISLDDLGVEHGVIKAGRPACARHAVQLASVQTLAERPDALPPADIVVVDETHHAVAVTWRAIIARYPHLELLLGLTATPERGDRSPLGDIYERLIVGATVAELQRTLRPDGHPILVPCVVKRPPESQRDLADHPIDALLRFARHAGASDAGPLFGQRRTAIRPSLLFASNVKTARELAEEANARGIRAACVDGATEARSRRRTIEDFHAGRLDLITNVYVLTEGFDSPRAEVACIARGCSCASTYLQIIGRVLRASPATGKRSALVVDLRGVAHVHGLPEAERAYSLDGKAISLREKVLVRQCDRCGACFVPAVVCPECGAHLGRIPRAIQVRRAELGEHALQDPREAKRGHYYALVKLGRSKGYKSGWAKHRFRAMHGFDPPWAGGDVSGGHHTEVSSG